MMGIISRGIFNACTLTTTERPYLATGIKIGGSPKLIFRHFSPDGNLLNEYIVNSE